MRFPPPAAGKTGLRRPLMHEREEQDRVPGAGSPTPPSPLVDAAVEGLPVGVAIVDTDLRYVYVNEAFAALDGVSPSEHIGRAVHDVLPPQMGEVLESQMRRVLETGEPVAALGEQLPLRARLAAIRAPDGIAGVAGVVEPLTGAGLGVEDERATEERYRAVFESLPLGVVVLDVDGRVVDANPAVERMLGYEPGELVGGTLDDFVEPEDVERELPLLADLLDGRRERYVIEKRYKRKDGQQLWGRAHVAAVHDPDGRLRYVLGVVDDVTPEREAADERASLEEQLRQSQKMEALGRLAGGVAHDFNNLLQVVRGHAQLALASADVPYVHEHLRELVAAASRAASLTSQLLTFSRQHPLEATRLDLNDVVVEIDGMLRRLLGPDIQLAIVLAPEPCIIECGRTQIQQVLVNLAINARDAMPHGGRIEIETRLEERDDGRYAVVTVADTGVGMDPTTLERAFDPFFTTKEAGKGTGLGLSTVDGIVAQCCGKITVRSAPDAGTRFEVSFPEAAGAADAEPSAPPRRRARGHETLLLVDDDDGVRALAAEYLGSQGYRVLTAASGREALEIFDREPVDLVVTDSLMPHMTGEELHRRLSAVHPGLPVVYMSGYDPADLPERDPNAAFLQKPHDLVTLAETVRSVLDEHDSGSPTVEPDRS